MTAISGLEQTLLKSLFFIYATGMVAYLAYVASGIKGLRSLGTFVGVLAAAVSLVDLVLRGIASQRIPTATLAEFSMMMLFCLVVIYLVIDLRSLRRGVDLGLIGAMVMAVCFGLLIYLFFGLKVGHETAEQMPPVLKSYWRTIHVFSAGPGYGGVVIAFALGLLYLIRLKLQLPEPKQGGAQSGLAARIPNAETLDRLCYLSIAFSFPFLTLLNVTGAIWAAVSWNRYWGWDAKEVWSLITWLVYAIYLHMRLRREWSGPKLAWVAVIGLGVMLFTLLGVNYLPQFQGSLHSYAGGK